MSWEELEHLQEEAQETSNDANDVFENVLNYAKQWLKDNPPPTLDELKAYAEATLQEPRLEAVKAYMRLQPEYYAVMDSFRNPITSEMLEAWRKVFRNHESKITWMGPDCY